MQDTYIFPAIFHLEDDNSYWVEFPNFPLANTQGEDLEDALYMAKDCLAGYISYMEEEGQNIPKATIPYTKKIGKNSFVQLIEVYLPPYRDEYLNKMERKNVTIPRWLNQIAKKKNINCSAILVSALKNN
ncbi:type II toxin-antitoxin system HicB family antitoxin [Fusobacterium simiae]|uniref:Type II toxin-antitoxin system HicB family antitoxin n=1 Tax=Fusobacterium simiae TaxID=855 RepID=A0ABT4DJS9_FUSSI|nr:type II toxin-antitoxin system HicB family antitoxin [Fusobacterium simiae]MCY7007519.1 type II toxin-antitoxin system HicB family antitoxin [Fusobacterium simiae]